MTNTPFKIVTDVFPIPRTTFARNKGTGLVSPVSRAFYELATAAPVGASFFVPDSACSKISSLLARGYQIAGKGWASVRKVEDGHRVWKHAEPNMSEHQRRYTLQGVDQ